MQKKKSPTKYFWVFCAIAFLSLVSMVYYGSQKSGYHVDEVYSFGLANSEYLPFMHFGESGYDVKDWMLEYGAGESFGDLFRNLVKDYKILKENDFNIYSSSLYQDYLIAQSNSADTRTTTWVSGKDYLHYLTVAPENTFNYASVYYNQRGDVHPPFFYMLLHTVCSFFPESFSKWYGLGINIVFMLMTLFLVYRLCSKHLSGDKLFGLCVAAVYGLSCGFVTTAIFLRMYAVLTFMVVLACYLHFELEENDFTMSRRSGWKLSLITFLGFYTHYYFVLYAIAIAAVSCIWMLCKKRFKDMFVYIATMAGTGAVGVCLWPFAIRHVFHGYRGMYAVKTSLAGGAYFLKTRLMLDIVWSQIAGSVKWLPFALLIVLLLIVLLWKRKEFPWGKAALLGVPVMFYVAAVAQIVPYYTDRYIMCSYFFWCILLVGGVYFSLRIVSEQFGIWQKEKGRRCTVIAIICLTAGLIWLNNSVRVMPGYLYLDGQETVEVPENTDCVYVLPDGSWNESAVDSTIMAQCRTVGVVYELEMEVLKEGYQGADGDTLMLCVNKELNLEAVLAKAHELFGTGDWRELSREERGSFIMIFFSK